jgi:osmotically-inducible protein OsmY
MNKYFPALMLSVILLSSCSPLGVATGVGASLGVAASQEGGISKAAEDARIQIEINDLWFRSNVDIFSKLDLTINQGRVLITGVVQDPEQRVEAVRLAWQPKGVKQVINEIQVAKSEGVVGFARDTWITTRLRTSMTFAKGIQSINYSIDTVQGTVYLMGFAQNQLELNSVTELARTISGVKGVVSYVKIIGVSEDTGAMNMQSGAYGDPQFTGNSYQQGQNYEPAPAQGGGPVVISPETYKAPAQGQRQGIETEVLR